MSSAGRGRLSNMWEAVFADVGVSVIAILNASRALKVKTKSAIIELSYNNINFLKRLPGFSRSLFWRCIREFLRFVPTVGLKNP